MARILVTGCSSGIGRDAVLHLDRLGHTVFAGVRKEADGDALGAASSERVTPLILDVTDQAHIDAAVKTIGESGGLDGLVNNAGIGRGGPLEHIAVDEWREQLEVNVIGQVAMTKAALPLLRQNRGRIVFIGSIGGRVGTMLMGPYNASKFAIEGIGDALRQELAPFGISVSIVEPGAIKTDIWDKAQDTLTRLERDLPTEALEQYRWHVDAFKAGLEKQAKQGVGPEKTSAAIEHALFSKRPKTRYLVGVDARAMATMQVALPDRVRDAVIRKLAY